MNLLQKYLNKAHESGQLVDIYRERHSDDGAEFCRIDSLSDDFVQVTMVDDSGNYDGVAVFDIDHITRLRWDGTERDAQTKLVVRSGTLPPAPPLNLISWEAILESVQKHFGHVTVHIQNIDKSICFIGELVEQDNEYFLLHEYRTMKSLDRAYLILEEIEVTLVEADGKYERDLIYLHEGVSP